MNTETINAFPFDPCELPFSIEVSGITDCTDFYITKRTNSYCYILEYILEGSGTLIYENKTYEIEKGDIYLIHKGSNHEYYPDRKDPWKKIWFNIDGILVPSLLTSYSLNNTFVFKHFNDPSLFEEMYKLTSDNLSKKAVMSEAGIIFHRIIDKIYQFQTANNVKSGVNAIKDLLDANLYRSDFSIQEISDILCISKSHIINTFKKAYSQTPYQYFISQRVQIACSMLLNSQVSINEISETLDFADQHYFTNVFKRLKGVTPSQFRKSNSNEYIALSNRNIKPDQKKDEEKTINITKY